MLCLVFLVSSIIVTAPAYAIRLTNVKHLFDITHNFSQPSDIAVSKDGHIYVMDGVNNMIKVFNRDGKFVFSFGSKGSLTGQFLFPLGLDIGSSGKVYVADSGNHRIQIFGPTGN
ncbi:MAG: NHL repeat-containing protein, partial [Nitrospirota bacterium]